MTAPVYVLGGWQSDFAQRAGDYFGLLDETARSALDALGVDAAEVEAAHVGNFIGELTCEQGQLGGLLATVDPAWAGMPVGRHEAACASGSLAALGAMADIESGRYDVVLVIGAEILRNVGGRRAAELMNCGGWAGEETLAGELLWPTQFAEVAAEYATRWGLSHGHLGRIAEINFGNAQLNPNAQTRSWDLSSEDFTEDDSANPAICGVLRKTDCGRVTDGAAAVILVSGRAAADYATRHGAELKSIPRIKGWSHRTAPMRLKDKLALAQDGSYLFPHVRRAVVEALGRAGMEDVFALDAVEVHDCFSVSEYVAIDHLGLTEPGESWKAVEDGTIELGGRLPINASGGLLGLGHPVGATGVRMLLDAVKQVTNTAGEYQVPGARNVATSNIGGSFTTVVNLVVGVESEA
jgi:acetyl-CoA C-acetyltransferase